MSDDREARVADRPACPLIVFDGDCAFCRQWVDRWRGMAGEGFEYRPYREVAGRFPEVGESGFKSRVWLIEPDGRALGRAGAVFRLYALMGARRWPERLHRHLPAFAGASEAAYDFVAGHRDAASRVVRWLWGSIDRRPTYRRTRSILLRGLGLVYLAAFASLAVQVDGLIGSRGIAPAAEYLDRVREVLGGPDYGRVPTLLWLGASDRALRGLCWGGVAVSGLLVAGILPGFCLVFLWLAYLSMVVVGQPFLGYQWDVLLLESGLLGLLLTPWGFRLGRARGEPPALSIWLFRWLVFRLMFLSGVVKLTSGDPAWSAWQAMKYHYETQPLPTWTSWYMHQLPPRLQEWSVGFTFWSELVAPFLIFGPRKVRMVGLASLVLLQALIAATGNYGFFNLLAVVLCLSLVEDRDWFVKKAAPPLGPPRNPAGRAALAAAGAVIVSVTTMEGIDRSGWTVIFPESLEAVRAWVSPFHSMNAYGLFAVMTTERPEIIVEGSEDGAGWKSYTFRWKPGDVGRAPRFCTPHMPRLDWQMWFAALAGDCRSAPWFLSFERALFEGSPEVLGLLGPDPFAGKPPKYLRARMYQYHFTGRGDRAWWRREEAGLFCPPLGPWPRIRE